MLIKPVMIGLEEITEDEFILMELNGEKIEGGGTVGQVPQEYHIHSEIYKARPEVGSVSHTHPPYCVALSSTGQTPKAYSLEGRQFADGVPLFGETTQTITTPELGQAVVRTMAGKNAAVLQYHGVAIAGATIQETCLRNVALERAARNHLIAHQFGTPTPLGPARGGGFSPEITQSRAQPTWDYYVRRADRILFGKR